MDPAPGHILGKRIGAFIDRKFDLVMPPDDQSHRRGRRLFLGLNALDGLFANTANLVHVNDGADIEDRLDSMTVPLLMAGAPEGEDE